MQRWYRKRRITRKPTKTPHKPAPSFRPPLYTKYYIFTGRYYLSIAHEATREYQQFAAHRIQLAWFAARFRRFAKYKRRAIYSLAARSIQRAWRAYVIRVAARSVAVPSTRGLSDASAARIQRAYRRYLMRKTYFYYRSLLLSHERQDPLVLLRLLVHERSALLDQRSGLYLRFRLGGQTFPPNIYYKIYSAIPVVDIQSFAPRDYASEAAALKRLAKAAGPLREAEEAAIRQDQSSWYRRVENNGWRLLATNDALSSDAAQLPAKAAATFFHPNRLVRQAEAMRRRKAKKRQWLQKLYQAGMTKEKKTQGKEEKHFEWSDDADDVADSGSGSGSVSVSEGEASDLLAWTRELDYEQYQEGWIKQATTRPVNTNTIANTKDREYDTK